MHLAQNQVASCVSCAEGTAPDPTMSLSTATTELSSQYQNHPFMLFNCRTQSFSLEPQGQKTKSFDYHLMQMIYYMQKTLTLQDSLKKEK